MLVKLTDNERDELIRLVDVAIRDLGPEIRHTRTWDYKDELKAHRRFLQMLQDHLTRPGDDGPISGSPLAPAGTTHER
jgi:hypothetical protein